MKRENRNQKKTPGLFLFPERKKGTVQVPPLGYEGSTKVIVLDPIRKGAGDIK